MVDPAVDMYQIAVLIDQLKHDDVHFRVNASASLARIALALGPERARDELIPFLCGKIEGMRRQEGSTFPSPHKNQPIICFIFPRPVPITPPFLKLRRDN